MATTPTPAPPLTDAAPTVGSLRTLGQGAQQAAPGTDSRLATPTNATTTAAAGKIPVANVSGILDPAWIGAMGPGAGTYGNTAGGFYIKAVTVDAYGRILGLSVGTSASASGTVTSVATDSTLSGGPITTTGTLGINLANANTWTGNQNFGTAQVGTLGTGGSGIQYGGVSDTNWVTRIGGSAFTKIINTGNGVYTNYYPGYGASWGPVGGTADFEVTASMAFVNGKVEFADSSAALSATGRAAIRYNNTAGQIQQSVNGAAWTNFATGTVTSIALTAPSFLTVSGSGGTTAVSLGLSLATQAAHTFFLGPLSGVAAAPTFRVLDSTDLPASGVSLGSYTNANITVDVTGRITAASNGAAGISGLTTTRVPFAASSTTLSDSANLNWDNTSSTLNVNRNAVGTNINPSLQAVNATAAALGVQQNSPAIVFGGQGWSTLSSTSISTLSAIFTRPVQQTSADPLAEIVFLSFVSSPAEIMSASTLSLRSASTTTSLGTAAAPWGTLFNNKLQLASNAASPTTAGQMVWDGTNFKYTTNGTSWTNFATGGGSTGNYTFTGNVADLTASGVMQLGSTNTTAVQLNTVQSASGTSLILKGQQTNTANTGMIFNNTANYTAANSLGYEWQDHGNTIMSLRPGTFGQTVLAFHDGASGTAFAKLVANASVSILNNAGTPYPFVAGPTTLVGVSSYNHKVDKCGSSTQAWGEVWSQAHVGVHLDTSSLSAVSINTQTGEMQVLTSTGNVTSITLAAGKPAQLFTLELVQGNATHTWPTTITNARLSGGSFTKTATLNAVNVLHFRYNTTSSTWDQLGTTTTIS